MTDVSEHNERESETVANVDAPADSKLVQITLNGVTLTVKKIVSVEELLRKAYGASAILNLYEDYYIVPAQEHDEVEKPDEYHRGMSIEVSESMRYLAVPKRLAGFA